MKAALVSSSPLGGCLCSPKLLTLFPRHAVPAGGRWLNANVWLVLMIFLAAEINSAQAVTLPATHDSYVRGGSESGTNYGSDTRVRVRYDDAGAFYEYEGYLMFDISSVSSISSATIRVYGASSHGGGVGDVIGCYSVSNTSWTESSITWSNKPSASGSALDTTTMAGTTDQWYEFDVTSYVQAQKAASASNVAFALIGATDSYSFSDFNSSETSSNQVELVIVTSGGGQVAAPAFSPAAGSYSSVQNVTITSATSGATIRYTTNGTTPTSTSGTVYSSPVSISSTSTLKAIAYKSGMTDSSVTSGTYTITPGTVSAPAFSPVAGSYSSTQNVTISTSTSGATIRYTTNGTTPSSTVGTVYSSAVVISSTSTLKAIAYKSGMNDSSVTSGTYTITGGGGGSTSLSATHDSYVRGGSQSSTNYGTETKVRVRYDDAGANYEYEGYLMFDISSVSSITDATLRVYGASSHGGGVGDVIGCYSVSNTSWTESSVTWDNKPSAGGTALDTITMAGTTAQWYEFDVTSYVQAQKSASASNVAFALIGATDSHSFSDFNSSEAGSNQVELVITGSGGGGSTVAAPSFSPPAGTYGSAQNVTITTATSGATIRYTTNGTTPSSTVGTVYSSPVSIAATSTLKAIAYKSGMTDSSVTSGAYTISGGSTAGIAGVRASTGIFFQLGPEAGPVNAASNLNAFQAEMDRTPANNDPIRYISLSMSKKQKNTSGTDLGFLGVAKGNATSMAGQFDGVPTVTLCIILPLWTVPNDVVTLAAKNARANEILAGQHDADFIDGIFAKFDDAGMADRVIFRLGHEAEIGYPWHKLDMNENLWRNTWDYVAALGKGVNSNFRFDYQGNGPFFLVVSESDSRDQWEFACPTNPDIIGCDLYIGNKSTTRVLDEVAELQAVAASMGVPFSIPELGAFTTASGRNGENHTDTDVKNFVIDLIDLLKTFPASGPGSCLYWSWFEGLGDTALVGTDSGVWPSSTPNWPLAWAEYKAQLGN